MENEYRNKLFATVAAQDIDAIPDDIDAIDRFTLNSIRAVTHRSDISAMCAFVYSEAPRPETSTSGFHRIAHMQDGHGIISGNIIATNQDANNGMSRPCKTATPEAIMDELEDINLGDRCTVIWDVEQCVATIYPVGVSSPNNHIRKKFKLDDDDLSQDEVRVALDNTYRENLKNPSAHTVRLWSNLTLIERAEDELERHIKGQLTAFFLGRKRPVKILPQTSTSAGRCDLIFLQRGKSAGPRMMGVLELKVLRGPETRNKKITTEGLSQGFYYRQELDLPFAILALYDVSEVPTDSLEEVMFDQPPDHVEIVLVVRYPIYNSPKSWRDSQISSTI